MGWTDPLETATRKKIDLMLNNLGWHTDEFAKDCNVTTERAKTEEQNQKLKKLSGFRKPPDYVLYKSGSDLPIGVIEAKRRGQNVQDALDRAKKLYAKPLGVKIVFAYDGSFFKSEKTDEGKELKIDGMTVTQLLSEKQILRFIDEGSNITEAEPAVKYSRAELIEVFKFANNRLRKEGLREGIERFTEFSNILFLKLISEIEEDREKHGENRILEEKYCWNAFSKKEADDMLVYINKIVLDRLVNQYNHSGDVFENELKIKNPDTLKAIVNKLSKIDLKNADSDVKGDAFEYFLKTSITLGNDLGEYFTPRHIVNLMVDLLDPKFGETVYDPTCGTGGFLISAFNYIKRRSANNAAIIKKLKEDTVYGRELTSTAKIAKMNMIITGDGHNNIKQMDSLSDPVSNKYNIVVANPPYGQDTDYGVHYRYPYTSSDGIFLQHIILSLKDDGRCAVVIPEGLLFRDVDLDLRKYMLRFCKIIAIISLPKGVFRPYAKQNKTNIIILEKENEEEAKGTDSIWFYDLKHDGFDLNSDLRPEMDENDIPDLLDKWSAKMDGKNSWSVAINKIKEKNYDLMAKTYMPVDEYTSRYLQVPFSEIMTENKEYIIIDDQTQYQRITVKLHGKGVVSRDFVMGKKLRTKKQKLAKTNQFVVAELDAKFGGFGVIPENLEDSIVSSHYYLFDLDPDKVLPEYFDYMVRKGPYTEIIQPNVKGTTNYASVRPKHLLELKMPLPDIAEQEKILQDISDKMQVLVELKRAKEQASLDIQDIVDSLFQKIPKAVA